MALHRLVLHAKMERRLSLLRNHYWFDRNYSCCVNPPRLVALVLDPDASACSGYVGAPSAMAIGVISVACANYSTKLKHIFKSVLSSSSFVSLTNLTNHRFDDALDVFATHAVGGIVGSLLTGIFADSRVAGFDGITVIPGGWINQHYIQLAYQLANTVYIAAYSFTVTYLILFVMNRIPGLHLRATEEAEILGIDEDQCGEAGYDYAFINRDVEDPQG